MATPRFAYLGIDAAGIQPKVVAWMYGLPLTQPEAMAVSAYQAEAATDLDRALMAAWMVKMTLVHGSWVAEQCGWLIPETHP